MTTLREFKAKYLAKLLNMKKQLLDRYPEKRERVEYIIDLLASKLENLRTFTLTDYLFTLHLATKEFPELEQLIPTEEEVQELIEGGE
jgi:DNA polymerase III sliding clamp (beta) subunit (PCNA family)